MALQQLDNSDTQVEIRGELVIVAKIYPCFYLDPNTCYEGRPSSDDSDYASKYSEWGRRHYGHEWHRRRQLMLETRNVYVQRDDLYLRRQNDLRELEDAVDGRLLPGGMTGAVWKSIWSRTPPVPPPQEADPDPDSSDALSLKQLNENRKALGWTDEEYEYHKCRMETRIAAIRRSCEEDEIGNSEVELERKMLREEESKLEASTLPRDSVAYSRLFEAYERLSDRFARLRCGEPKSTVDKDYDRGNAAAKAREEADDELLERGPKEQTELTKRLERWQKYGLTVDEHDRLVKLHGFDPFERPDYAADDSKYNGYDYLSLCKRTKKTRPLPTESEFESLAKTWEVGLILNRKEIAELKSMYGLGSQTPDASPTRQRAPTPPKRSPRRSARLPKPTSATTKADDFVEVRGRKRTSDIGRLRSDDRERASKSPKKSPQKSAHYNLRFDSRCEQSPLLSS